MNHWNCTNGEKVTQHRLERNIRIAKQIKKDNFLKQHGFIFCEFTGVNASADIIDTMHIISVDKCKKMGKSELAWSQSNLKYGSRKFHEKFDNQPSRERIKIFEQLNNCKL